MKEQIIEYLNNRIAECYSSAEELIQECDNESDANKEFAKISAFKEAIDFINTLPE